MRTFSRSVFMRIKILYICVFMLYIVLIAAGIKRKRMECVDVENKIDGC